jgi:hypothetical protein
MQQSTNTAATIPGQAPPCCHRSPDIIAWDQIDHCFAVIELAYTNDKTIILNDECRRAIDMFADRWYDEDGNLIGGDCSDPSGTPNILRPALAWGSGLSELSSMGDDPHASRRTLFTRERKLPTHQENPLIRPEWSQKDSEHQSVSARFYSRHIRMGAITANEDSFEECARRWRTSPRAGKIVRYTPMCEALTKHLKAQLNVSPHLQRVLGLERKNIAALPATSLYPLVMGTRGSLSKAWEVTTMKLLRCKAGSPILQNLAVKLTGIATDHVVSIVRAFMHEK